MISFEVAGKEYKARELDVFDQMVIAKRLMPVMKNVITPEIIAAVLATQKPNEKAADRPALGLDASAMIKALADAIYSLTDDDAKAIVKMTLRVVERKNTGTGGQGIWSPLATPDGLIMDKSLKLPEIMTIVVRVIEGHVGDFFAIAQ